MAAYVHKFTSKVKYSHVLSDPLKFYLGMVMVCFILLGFKSIQLEI